VRLIGTRAEAIEREELVTSNQALQDDNDALSVALSTVGVDRTNAYVVGWVPDQSEDIVSVLVSEDHVLILEIDRLGKVLDVERQCFDEYRSQRSNSARIKLDVARDLIRQGREKAGTRR
jgi:hypothetical protein